MPMNRSAWTFCVAPMMDWTDRHDRYFLRRLSRHARLYTEMVTTGALLHGDRDRFLRFDAAEHPVALQLGGCEPDALAACARFGEDAGFDEINLNCGCPSSRVQEGRFGACLMQEPQRVADAVAAMRAAVRIPVTVKCRIGVDRDAGASFLENFVRTVAAAGCTVFIIHARSAWLKGLSPKENREVPPLQPELVYDLRQRFPHLTVVLNGGIRSLDAAAAHLERVDGVMLGREAYENPYLLATVDRRFFDPQARVASRETVLRELHPFVAAELARGTALPHITRHLLGLYRGEPGARQFRRILAQDARRPGAGLEVLARALDAVTRARALDAAA